MADLFEEGAKTSKPDAPRAFDCGAYSYIECMSREEWLRERKAFMVPASEVPMIMGDFKSKSSVRLAMEKSGMADPADLSDDEMINRGREREPVIRREFAERHDCLKVTHHPYRIYYSKERPWMSCTLDGEFTVEQESPVELKVGSHGGIECKSVGYRSMKELEDFKRTSIPVAKFYEQCLAQMYVRNLDCIYIIVELAYIGDPELQGECPDHYVKEFFFTKDRDVQADMKLVLDTCDSFKKRMDAGQLPDTQLSSPSDDDGEVVVLQADVEVGRFIENFDKVKTAVEHMVEPYKGAVFTEETAKDAKAMHAELNAMGNSIEEKRKAIKKKYLEPYNAFEAKAKALKQIIDDVRIPISEQLKTFEEEKRQKKVAEIKAVIEQSIDEKIAEDEVRAYYRSIGGVAVNDRWLLSKTSKTQVRDDIGLTITAFLSDYSAIMAVCGDDGELLSMLLSEYERTRSLAETLQTKDRIVNARRQAEAARKAREQKAVDEGSHAIGAPLPPLYEEDRKEPVHGEKVYTFTFRASHASQSEWKDLIAYMKAHGFKYEQVR